MESLSVLKTERKVDRMSYEEIEIRKWANKQNKTIKRRTLKLLKEAKENSKTGGAIVGIYLSIRQKESG